MRLVRGVPKLWTTIEEILFSLTLFFFFFILQIDCRCCNPSPWSEIIFDRLIVLVSLKQMRVYYSPLLLQPIFYNLHYILKSLMWWIEFFTGKIKSNNCSSQEIVFGKRDKWASSDLGHTAYHCCILKTLNQYPTFVTIKRSLLSRLQPVTGTKYTNDCNCKNEWDDHCDHLGQPNSSSYTRPRRRASCAYC